MCAAGVRRPLCGDAKRRRRSGVSSSGAEMPFTGHTTCGWHFGGFAMAMRSSRCGESGE